MSITQSQITREFKYNSLKLVDPAPAMTPDQVRVHLAAMYPELLTAVIEGPVTKGGVSTYTFVRSAGSKGSGHARALKRFLEKGFTQDGDPLDGATPAKLENNKQCSKIVKAVVNNVHRSTPMLPQQTAYSHFG